MTYKLTEVKGTSYWYDSGDSNESIEQILKEFEAQDSAPQSVVPNRLSRFLSYLEISKGFKSRMPMDRADEYFSLPATYRTTFD